MYVGNNMILKIDLKNHIIFLQTMVLLSLFLLIILKMFPFTKIKYFFKWSWYKSINTYSFCSGSQALYIAGLGKDCYRSTTTCISVIYAAVEDS